MKYRNTGDGKSGVETFPPDPRLLKMFKEKGLKK
jgi:hypothetical protein